MGKRVAILLAGISLVVHNVAVGADRASKKAPTADKPAAQPDIKFLEYLGTVEDDEENWTQIDLEQVTTKVLAAPEGKAKTEAAAKPATEKK